MGNAGTLGSLASQNRKGRISAQLAPVARHDLPGRGQPFNGTETRTGKIGHRRTDATKPPQATTAVFEASWSD
jgi:hypothetical protein